MVYFSKKTTHLLLFLILALAIFLRVWGIDSAPPGVLIDEASFGYNAYSILKTGKDEWGERLPLTFRSFGDYKPPGYIYLTVPFVKLFGLNPFSTRITSSISGVVTVFLVFLLIKLLTKKTNLAIISSFILTISPWHIYMSRMAWDSNIALMFLLAGLYFLLKALENKLSNLLLSSIFFSLALYSYAGYRLITPLLIIVVLIFLRLKKIINLKKIIFFLFFLFFFLSPLIPEVLFKGALSRFNQVSIFNQQDNTLVINEKRAFCGMQENKLLLKTCYLVWNKPFVITATFFKRYITSFSYDFLFYPGDQALFLNNPEHGGLYYWLFPFFLLGLLIIFKNYKKTSYQLILITLLIAPVATAVSGQPHYERVNLIFIPIIFICALGVDLFFQKIKRYKKLSHTSTFIFLLISFSSLFVTMLDYFFVYTKRVEAWDEHQRKIYDYINKVDKNYDSIYIKKINNNPYMYLSYYLALDPTYLQNNIERREYEVLSIGKYHFVDSSINTVYCQWLKESKPRTLFVTDEYDQELKPVYKATSFNGVYTRAVIYDLSENKNIVCQ